MTKQNNKITFDLEKASSGNIEKKFYGGSSGGYYIGIDWKVNSQSVSSNSSNVTATFYIRSSGSGYTISSSASKSVKITIDGSSYSGSSTVGLGTNQKKNLISKTVTVKHNSDGTKTCSFACTANIALTLGGTKYNTVSHSGSGSFNKINLNSAPTWSTDDTRIKWNGKEIKAHVTIPENVSTVEVISAQATDKEQGSNLVYELHRYINDNYSAKIKSASSGLTATDNLSSWGQGTKFEYEAKVGDGQVQASSSRWSWEYTKNIFKAATFSSADSINNDSQRFVVTVTGAQNSGGGNGYVDTNFTYKLESLTPGVNIYGDPYLTRTDSSNVSYGIGIEKDGHLATGDWHHLKYEEIRNYLQSNNFVGTIKLRIVSSNSYGSSGTTDFNINVDFRIAPSYAQVEYDENNKINFKGQDYYVHTLLPFHVRWNEVRDPIDNLPCTYEVLYQIEDEPWVSLGRTSSTEYTAFLGSSIGNRDVERFSIIIKSITNYGYESNARGTIIKLWNYKIPDITVTSISRNSEDVTITGNVKINTNIPNVSTSNSTWKWINGLSGNGAFATDGTGNTKTFTFNADIPKTVTGVMTISTSDEIKDLIDKIASVENSFTNITVKGFMPILSLTKKGLGVNTRPLEGYKLTVEGESVFLGRISSKFTDESSVSTTSAILSNTSNNEALIGITNTDSNDLKDYVKIATNKLQYTTNSNTYDIYHSGNKPSISDMGAAPVNHNHDNTYLKLSGGIMTGPLTSWAPNDSYKSGFLATTKEDNNGSGDGNTHIGYKENSGVFSHYFRGKGKVYISCAGGIQADNLIKGLKGMELAHSLYIGTYEDVFRAVNFKRRSSNRDYEAKFGISYRNGKLASSNSQEMFYGGVIEAHDTVNPQARYLFTNKCFIPDSDNNKYLGISTNRWQAAYCTEGKFYTSTKSYKTNINYIDDNKANMFSSENPKSIKDYIIEAIKDTPLAVYNYKTRMMNNPGSEDVTENPMFVGFIADDLAVKHPEFFDLIGEKGEHERPILDENGEKTYKTVKETQYDISDISMLGVLWAGLQEALLKIDKLEQEIKNMKGVK